MLRLKEHCLPGQDAAEAGALASLFVHVRPCPKAFRNLAVPCEHGQRSSL